MLVHLRLLPAPGPPRPTTILTQHVHLVQNHATALGLLGKQVSFSDPDPNRPLGPVLQVFIGLEKKRLLTKRARAMASALLRGAFGVDSDDLLPDHVVYHQNGTDNIKVKFNTRPHFQQFLELPGRILHSRTNSVTLSPSTRSPTPVWRSSRWGAS